MSVGNFLRGALDKMPDGLDFAQSVHQGRLANEKMGMELQKFDIDRQQFDTQSKLQNLQLGALEDENRKVRPEELAIKIAENSKVSQGELIKFFDAFKDQDGYIRQKNLKDGLEYINDPATTERLFPMVLSEYNQNIADLTAELNRKPASGGYKLSPQERKVREDKITEFKQKIQHLQNNSKSWQWRQSFDSDEKHKRIMEDLARRKASEGGTGGLTFKQAADIKGKALQYGEQYQREEYPDRYASAFSQDANKFLMVMKDPRKSGRDAKNQRKAEPWEVKKMKSDIREEGINQYYKELGIPRYMIDQVAGSDYITPPGTQIDIPVPGEKTKPSATAQPTQAITTDTKFVTPDKRYLSPSGQAAANFNEGVGNAANSVGSLLGKYNQKRELANQYNRAMASAKSFEEKRKIEKMYRESLAKLK